jgi:septum formation protein
MKIILASASPRRKDIFELLGIPFSIIPADIDESVRPTENPEAYVERLAREKAATAVSLTQDQFPDAFVIGSDLTLDLDGIAIGKANDRDQALQFLKNFSGRTHFGRCGWAVMQGEQLLGSGVTTTIVEFKKLTSSEIASYLDSNEWTGLGGAYGVQNHGAAFIKTFRGSYYNILGLPVYEIAETLISYGVVIASANLALLREQDLNKVVGLNN